MFGNEESRLSYEGAKPFGIIITYLAINHCDKKHTPPPPKCGAFKVNRCILRFELWI